MVRLMALLLVLPLVTSIVTDKVGQPSYLINHLFRILLWMVLTGVVEHVTTLAVVKTVRE